MNDTEKASPARPVAPGRRPRDVVDDAFALVRQELAGFVDRHMRERHFAGDNWHAIATRFWLGDKTRDDPGNLLRVIDDNWTCFADVLGDESRQVVRNLRTARKELSSRRPFTVAQATRAVGEIGDLLDAAGANSRLAVSDIVGALEGTDVGRELARGAATADAHQAAPVVRVREEVRNESLRAGRIDRVVSHFGTRYEQAGTVHLDTSARGARLRRAS